MLLQPETENPFVEARSAQRDLSATGELLELEALARPVHATNGDGKRIADDFNEREPEWSRVEARCSELLGQSHDLRVACFYTAALLRTQGLSGFVRGLTVVAKLGAHDPTKVYPLLDPADSSSSTERWYTLTALSAPLAQDGDLLRIVDGLRALPLVRGKEGAFSGGDLSAIRSAGTGAAPEMVARLRRQWESVPPSGRADVVGSLRSAMTLLAAIEECLIEQTPESQIPPGFAQRPLRLLDEELRGWVSFLGSSEVPVVPSAAVPAAAPTPVGGRIQTRADAIRYLQEVKEFFKQTEPGSPVPFFIDRAVRLVDRDFMTLLTELAPDAVGRFQMITGLDHKTTS